MHHLLPSRLRRLPVEPPGLCSTPSTCSPRNGSGKPLTATTTHATSTCRETQVKMQAALFVPPPSFCRSGMTKTRTSWASASFPRGQDCRGAICGGVSVPVTSMPHRRSGERTPLRHGHREGPCTATASERCSAGVLASISCASGVTPGRVPLIPPRVARDRTMVYTRGGSRKLQGLEPPTRGRGELRLRVTR